MRLHRSSESRRLHTGVIVTQVVLPDRTGYQATAYRVDASGKRHAVVNTTGQPLVAFGSTPLKATAYLLSAVRRGVARQLAGDAAGASAS